MQGCYTNARKAAADNWSDFYQAKTTAGMNPMGPNAPRTGAGHRCAYWAGRLDTPSMYGRDRNTLGYAFWVAGVDDRKDASK